MLAHFPRLSFTLAQIREMNMSPLIDSDSSMLEDLCQSLPFLTQLPLDLLRSIDTTTLYVPNGAIAEMRAELESRLHCHIMTYRAVPLASSGHERLHLCRLLVPACLVPAQLEELQLSEEACRKEGVVLVAYMKPLQLREHPANKLTWSN